MTASERTKAWRKANPEKFRASSKRWRDAHPEKIREYNRRYQEKVKARQKGRDTEE